MTTGGGSGYAALFAHAEGVLYGMDIGSVPLKRLGFFCFPIKHSTHTGEMGNKLCGCGLSLNKTLLRTFLKVHTRHRSAYTLRCRGY